MTATRRTAAIILPHPVYIACKHIATLLCLKRGCKILKHNDYFLFLDIPMLTQINYFSLDMSFQNELTIFLGFLLLILRYM